MTIDELIYWADEMECSDIHLTVGTNMAYRRFGQLVISDDEMSPQEAKNLILALLTDEQQEHVLLGGDLDVGVVINNEIRIRANVYHQRNNLAASIRLLKKDIPGFAELGLSDTIRKLSERPHGLVLVTGPTGSGKSTTLAAMVNHINNTNACHVMTIEDPIEYIYPHNKAMIHQRELGRDVGGFATALRSAMREDPDIILVGEMRDFETISAALTAAETGHLVLSTLHSTSAAQTVERIIDASPIDAQAQIRIQFANVLAGVVTQNLIPLANGKGRVAATEIMVATPAVKNLIRDNKSIQIPNAILSGKKVGMQLMEEVIIDFVRNGRITPANAVKFSPDPDNMAKRLNYFPPD